VALIHEDPISTLLAWMSEAEAAGEPLPEAMTLATATKDGVPSARMVLLRGASDGDLRFFTCYESRKAGELEGNPRAALVFHWKSLTRQVRVEGRVERLSPEESDAYFATRPRGSQLSATISPQSRPIASLAELEHARDELDLRLAGKPVPRPANWGGYKIVPHTVELWIGGDHRLHDRFRYERHGAVWTMQRLAP
jgi:pyridoxamine 5'-phosphate oxidase